MKSGTTSGEVKPTQGSSTVRILGKPVIRDGDPCTLNGGNCPGIYITTQTPSGAVFQGSPTASTNPPITPETKEEEGFWHAASPWVHGALGVASFVPGLSVITGGADAAIYAGEGDMINAGLSAASMIPGGKVVTTVGKVAAGMIKGARAAEQAAKVAKAAHEIKEAEEAAKLAKKAEEATKEASQAEQAAQPYKGKDGATIKGVKEHQVPCFNPFDKAKYLAMNAEDKKKYLKEMADQLKRQQDMINSMSTAEYKAARDAFNAVGRNPLAEGAQSATRKEFAQSIEQSIAGSLQKDGWTAAKAEVEAVARSKDIMSKLAALHEPDMVAGGWMSPEPKGMGRADVNSSIGSSWNQGGRVGGMDAAADRSIQSGQGNAKMKVKLEVCRGK